MIITRFATGYTGFLFIFFRPRGDAKKAGAARRKPSKPVFAGKSAVRLVLRPAGRAKGAGTAACPMIPRIAENPNAHSCMAVRGNRPNGRPVSAAKPQRPDMRDPRPRPEQSQGFWEQAGAAPGAYLPPRARSSRISASTPSRTSGKRRSASARSLRCAS